MNYKDALEFIESTYRLGSRPGLVNITKLLELMGQPQLSFKTVHVAGTNGKGSTCAFIASILEQAGYSTGLYTSPHLERFTERIKVSGQEIGHPDVAGIAEYVKGCVATMLEQGYAHPTEFEIITAIGFEYFKRKKVDYAVVEVGMGGRLDATNVVNPELSIITPVSMDHMGVLGSHPVNIAREKAGIVKKGVPVLIGHQQADVLETIVSICTAKGAPFMHIGDGQIRNHRPVRFGQTFDFVWQGKGYQGLEIALVGRHQADNAVLALAAALELGVNESDIRKGLKRTKWPGRMEVIRREPFVLIDGAHNVEGAKVLTEGLGQFFPDKKVLLVLGMLRDKEVDRVAEIMAPNAEKIVTVSPASPRAMHPEELRDVVVKYNCNVVCEKSIEDAVKQYVTWAADRKPDEIVVFTGSLYMIGEVRKLLPPEVF